MIKKYYSSLLEAITVRYQNEQYEQAYQLVNRPTAGQVVNDAQLFNFKYSLASILNEPDEAIEAFREAVEDRGFWYPVDFINSDDDLALLREQEDFDRLIEICRQREERAMKQHNPSVKIISPRKRRGRPGLLIALHGNDENANIAEVIWDEPAFDNYYIMIPESSQIHYSNSYHWDDLTLATAEVNNQIAKVLEKYRIDQDNIVIGAFSSGASVAMELLMKPTFKTRGFCFISPWFSNLDDILDWTEKDNITLAPGLFIAGDADESVHEDVIELSKALERKDLAHGLNLYDGLGHEVPGDIGERFTEMFDHI